jgi:hypothetical protein
MKCYYHPEKDAVGVCFSCQKGICKECTIEIENVVACKNRCENNAKDLLELRQKTLHAPRRMKEYYSIMSYVFIIVGIFMMLITLSETNERLIIIGWLFTFFMLVLGVILFVFASNIWKKK